MDCRGCAPMVCAGQRWSTRASQQRTHQSVTPWRTRQRASMDRGNLPYRWARILRKFYFVSVLRKMVQGKWNRAQETEGLFPGADQEGLRRSPHNSRRKRGTRLSGDRPHLMTDVQMYRFDRLFRQLRIEQFLRKVENICQICTSVHLQIEFTRVTL